MEILRNRYGGYICVILLFMSCWTLPVAAAESDDYQPQETIRVGFFAFNDYHMMDADGHRSGYGYDVLQYMGRYTNWHYEYVGYDKSWEQMQSMLENGEIDMLTLAQPTPEGRLQFDFSSKSIGTSSALLTVRAGDERYTAGDYASYNGMRVGMIRGNNGNDSMAEFAADKGFSYVPVYFNGLEALEQALQDGQLIDAALTSSLHRADNAWVLEQFPERPFYVIVKKGNTRLLDEVDWALTQLDYYSPGWRLALFGRYAARSNDSDSLPLSRQERDYLKSLQQEKHVFKVAMNPDIPPYAYFDDEGNAEGILPELFAEIARRAGIRYEFLPSSSRKEYEQLLASGAADINLTNSTDYHEAEQNQMAMSSYFFDTSLSMVAKKEFSGMPKKLAVPSQYVSRYLHSMEPFKDQQVTIYASAGECIQAVLDGSCDGACLLTYHAQKIVREDVRSQLRTAVLPDTTTGICLGVSANNDYRLLPILNKSIESIHRGAIRQDIVLKYIMNVPEPPFSFERIFYQSPEEAVAIIVLLLLLCTGGALNWQFHKAAQRDHARRMELERFLGYVCRANDLVIELDIESGSGRSYRLENGKVHVEPARFSMAEYLAQIHPDDREPIESKLTEENIRKGIREQSSYYFECRVQAEDGSCRWYSHDLLSIPQSKLHPNSFIMFRKDIDGTKRSEEIQHQAICDALETARRASEAKGNFLSRMSHEIRTPLNAIIGYLMLAQQPEASSSKIQHCLANSEFAAKHLLNIINDVLDISAIESGRFKIAREAFNLPQQLTSLTSIFYRQSRDKDIIFSTSMQGIEAEWLLGDPMRIKQILINLLSNAVKFTAAGGTIQLLIGQTRTSAKQVLTKFEVRDTGIGMGEDYLSRIFKPFEQESAQTAQQFGGTGLGLSITQNLVRLMHGSIDVSSTPGEGSTFTVSLPLAISEKEREMSCEIVNNFAHIHALVVDDQSSECDYILSLLDRCHVRSDYVLSGAAAVEKISEKEGTQEAYDFCILDWKMPDMDGIETARRIREASPEKEMPIIIITAYDAESIEDEAAEAGVRRVCSKPLFPSTMFDLLMTYFGHHKADTERPPLSKVTLKGLHILLVEDNEMNREIAVAILEQAGLQITTAVNGQDALNQFTASIPGTYDAIFMDIQMPVMDGYEATRAIRRSSHPEARTMPIIAVTADVFSEDVAKALACGMNDYISKPIDYPKLIKALLKFTDPAKRH